MIENAIKIELGSSFFLNAGICGLLTFLEKNYADEGIDYEIDDQCVYLSVDYLKENDIPQMYINTMANCLGESTKFYRLINIDKGYIDSIYKNDIENIPKEQEKKLNEHYKAFIDKMLSSSYKSAYKLMENMDDIQPVTEELITDLKKCNDLTEKYNKYIKIINLLEQPEVKNMLIYTELIYTQLKLFFVENSQSKKITCLCKSDQLYEDTYRDNFINPLLNELDIEEKKKTSDCIECRNMTSAKGKKPFTFLCDTADDVNRKKNYYWNCKVDAFVCPVCAFVYSFIPLGFALVGSEAVFINNNSSVQSLVKVMNTCKAKGEDDNNSVRHKILRTLTAEKIDMLNNVTSNVQVIMNSSNFSHFKFDVIDKNLVLNLQKGKKYLSYLENKWVAFDDKNLNSVYDMVLDYIYDRRDLYFLLDKLIKAELKKDRTLNYLKGLLRLAVIFNGGANMDDLNKKVDYAFLAGNDLRKAVLGEKANGTENEDDNKLRGLVYRLVNLSSVGDREQFMDTIIRFYSGFGLTIPPIFKDCYTSDEMFKAISHGFVLGLKYVPYKKQNNNKEDTNNG